MADCPYIIDRSNLHNVRKQASAFLCDLDTRATTIENQFTITPVTGNTLLDGTNGTVLCDATSGDILITLPSAALWREKEYTIKKVDSSANVVTVDPDGTETIDGALTQIITGQWDAMKIKSDGTNWWII